MANLDIRWKDLLALHCMCKSLPKPDYAVSQKNGRQEVMQRNVFGINERYRLPFLVKTSRKRSTLEQT